MTSAPTPPNADESEPKEDARTVIARLAAMKPLDYETVRKEHAKSLGIQVKTLDDQVKAVRNEGLRTDRQPFVDVEPYGEPVDPGDVLDEVVVTIHRFIVLDAEQADAAALWVAHTHMTELAEVSPLALINAPEKACGKTAFQTLLGRMCHRPLPAANASLSALFRAVEQWKPTILIDEADTFFKDNPELHGMVNAGYKRGGFVLRSESTGDSFEPRMFSVYSAKSIAGIALEKHLPETTMSRGIVFNLRRKLPHEEVDRMRELDAPSLEELVSKIARFALDYAQQVRLARPTLPEQLSDRSQDNWEPLLAIAQCAGPAWLDRAVAAALKLSAASESQVSISNELLADIHHIVASRPEQRITTVDLIAALLEDHERPWATYNRGKSISPRQIAKHLDAYGIKSKTVRVGRLTLKGYEISQFEDAFARYLADSAKPPEPPNESEPDSPDENVY